MKDAEKHVAFPLLSAMLKDGVDTYDKLCFYRWTAMAFAVSEEGGWSKSIRTLSMILMFLMLLTSERHRYTPALSFSGGRFGVAKQREVYLP